MFETQTNEDTVIRDNVKRTTEARLCERLHSIAREEMLKAALGLAKSEASERLYRAIQNMEMMQQEKHSEHEIESMLEESFEEAIELAFNAAAGIL